MIHKLESRLSGKLSTISDNEAIQFRSAAQLCLTLCNPMDYSTPGFPVFHQLPELSQTHVHRVSDAIQPPHPLSSPSPALNLSQNQGLFQYFASGGQTIGVSASASVLPINIQDWFPLGWTGWDFLAIQGTLKSLLKYHGINKSIVDDAKVYMTEK